MTRSNESSSVVICSGAYFVPRMLYGGPEAQRRLIASERAIYWPLIRQLGIALD